MKMIRLRTKSSLILLIFFFLISTKVFYAQSPKYGLMPVSFNFSATAPNNIIGLKAATNENLERNQNIVDAYREKYRNIILDKLHQEIKSSQYFKDLLIEENISRDQRLKSVELYNAIRDEKGGYYFDSNPLIIGKKRVQDLHKQSTNMTGPLGNIFSEELNAEYLVLISLNGVYQASRSEFLGDTDAPETAYANMKAEIIILNGHTGLIKSISEVVFNSGKAMYDGRRLKKLEFSEKNIDKYIAKVIRNIDSEFKKFINK